MALVGLRGRTACFFAGSAVLALAAIGPARADPTFVLSGTLTTASGDPACGQLDVADPATDTSVSAPIVAGVFTITVPAGDELVHVSDGGCALAGLPAAWSLQPFPLTVAADSTIDLALPPTVTLSLHVTHSGAGVDGATVTGTDSAQPYVSGGLTLTPVQTIAGTADAAGAVDLIAFRDTDVAALDVTGVDGAAAVAAQVAHLQLLANKTFALATGPAAAPPVYQPPGAPTTVLAFPTGAPTAPSIRISWLAPSSTGGFPITGYVASASPGGASVLSSPSLTSVLLPGLDLTTEYTFTVVASNAIGPSVPSDPSAVVIPGVFDTTPPVPSMTGPAAAVTLASAAVPTWTATDLSGIGSYDLRWRVAHEDGVFGPILTKSKTTATTATSANVPIAIGTTMCFSIRAKDRAGNVSGWTDERCVTRPTDDATLTASAGWSTAPQSNAYNRTLSIGGAEATLSRDGTAFRQLTLLANTCRTCGVVEVSVDGTVIGTIDTYSPGKKLVRKVFLTLAVTDGLAVHSGSVTLRVVASGRTVQVDGVAFVAP